MYYLSLYPVQGRSQRGSRSDNVSLLEIVIKLSKVGDENGAISLLFIHWACLKRLDISSLSFYLLNYYVNLTNHIN